VRRLRVALAAVGSLLVAMIVAPAGRASADAGQRHGLRGDYYVSAPDTYGEFTTLKATVVDPAVDFDDLEPVLVGLTGQQDRATVRWTGQIRPRYSETYRFFMVGDNGFRLWIDKRLIIDHWVDDWDNPQTSTPITLRAGRAYDIRVEYFEHFGGSNVHLSWFSRSQRKEIVPNSALHLPPGFTPAGPLSSTVAASGLIVALTFATALPPLPAGVVGHFGLSVNGTDWPVTSVSLVRPGASTILLRLADPVPHPARNNVRAVYDGLGGITTTSGTPLPAFNTAALNNSTFQITTPWAAAVSPGNALPEYPRPQLVRDRWQSLNGLWQYEAGSSSRSRPPLGNLSERILVP